MSALDPALPVGEEVRLRYEARRRLIKERLANRNAAPAGETVLIPGIQCAHCNEVYELDTLLRKCYQCGEPVCRSHQCSCPGAPEADNQD